MNRYDITGTFRAALRVVAAHRTYLLVYLVGLSMMMVAMVGSVIGGHSDDATVYVQKRSKVAIIDRDRASEGAVAEGLRDYLSATCDEIDLADDAVTLQDAVARNAVDYMLIIPDGYTAEFERSVAAGDEPPALDSVTSYTSGFGAMADLQANGYLSLLRTAYAAQLAASQRNPELRPSMTQAVEQVADSTGDARADQDIAVVRTSDTDALWSSAVFGTALKYGVYPIAASMMVTVGLFVGAFNRERIRRRLEASAASSLSIGLGVLVACGLVGLIAVAYYMAISLAMVAFGGSMDGIGAGAVAMAALSVAAYTSACVAIGFLLGQCLVSEAVANAVANVLGLVIAFTSGTWFPVDSMPEIMTTIGRFLPGWWQADAVNRALGLTGESGAGVDAAGWAVSTGITLLFALAFVCLGLAVGRRRGVMRSR